jgi:hypothetical protein
MYQAKKLGKNQISGNPRPRPALLARRSAAEEEPPAAAEVPAKKAAGPPRNGMSGPSEHRAVAVELRPMVPPETPTAPKPPKAPDDSEPNPQDVRRQIATASRSFDPDHQIRRAMDAFLSPGIMERELDRERERPTPDH